MGSLRVEPEEGLGAGSRLASAAFTIGSASAAVTRRPAHLRIRHTNHTLRVCDVLKHHVRKPAGKLLSLLPLADEPLEAELEAASEGARGRVGG